MAKRFISTELFDDDWFMELKPTSKLLWVYFITKCDHAGIISFNEKLCKFQTGLNDVKSCLKDLKSRITKISDTQYFIPKFIYFQYPDFPNSRVNQQKGAIKILTKYGLLIDNELINITSLKDVESPLRTYGNDNGNDNGNGDVKIINTEFEKFKNWINKNAPNVEKLKEPINEEQFIKLKQYDAEIVKDVLLDMHNRKDLLTKYVSSYLTCLNWIKNRNNNNGTKTTSIIDRNRAVAEKFIRENLNGGSDL